MLFLQKPPNIFCIYSYKISTMILRTMRWNIYATIVCPSGTMRVKFKAKSERVTKDFW